MEMRPRYASYCPDQVEVGRLRFSKTNEMPELINTLL